MNKLPNYKNKTKIAVICEGFEDVEYFKRLLELGVWNYEYEFVPINAKSASNIPARYQNEFSNDKYSAILIFCDTDKAPYREYSKIINKINAFHDADVAKMITIYANPCTMQIVLLHFGEVSLETQAKQVNGDIIEKFTGVKGYDAHNEQIREICSKIYRRTYNDMKTRVQQINRPDTIPGSTNFYPFLLRFEGDSRDWIEEIHNAVNQSE